jgi:hypothetical protein
MCTIVVYVVTEFCLLLCFCEEKNKITSSHKFSPLIPPSVLDHHHHVCSGQSECQLFESIEWICELRGGL